MLKVSESFIKLSIARNFSDGGSLSEDGFDINSALVFSWPELERSAFEMTFDIYHPTIAAFNVDGLDFVIKVLIR